jgi:ferritin-like metal-binding protein YciE
MIGPISSVCRAFFNPLEEGHLPRGNANRSNCHQPGASTFMSGNETLISWLNDAYALEQELISILKNQASDAASYPHIQARLDQHLEETKRHADVVKDCVERLGGSTSATKAALGKMSAMFAAMGTAAAQDELVKNCLSDYSMEHFEIASYKALIASAEALGHPDIATACRRILSDEQRMAEWLDQTLPSVVQEHLSQQVNA